MHSAPHAPTLPHPGFTASVCERPTALAPAVVIGGWVRHPLRLSAAALRALGPRTVDFQVVCTLDGAHGGPRALRVVPLRVLIEQAVPAFEHRTDFKRVAIVAESAEGYRALFSWNELFNTAVGEGVGVAFDDPATPLERHAGPFALVSLGDHHTGPRYVRHLAMVELIKLW